MSSTIPQILHRISHQPFKDPNAKTPGWELERDALARFGGDSCRAILAVYHARREFQSSYFHVPHSISALYGFNTVTLNRALRRLDGHFIVIEDAPCRPRGAPHDIRLLPLWDNPEALQEGPDFLFRKFLAMGMGYNEGNNPHEIQSLIREISRRPLV